jgi:hypothetical protein
MRRDVAELRRLIEAAGLNQMSAARLLEMSPRAMQYCCQASRDEPVPVLVMLAMRQVVATLPVKAANT